MKNFLNILPWAALLTVALISVPRAAQTQERHPRIRAAISELREARNELKNAAHDYCGHRAAAIEQCDRALEQLQLAQECDRR